MKYLVTGGAGFIGYHLCKTLLEQHHKVLCMDDFSSGQERNIALLHQFPNFHFILHDVTLPLPLNSFEAEGIFHLACPASPKAYQRDPVKTLLTNFRGTFHMLEYAKAAQIPILLSSTSEVYGDPKVHPQTESYWGNVNPIGIRSCYDEGKRAAETLMADYHRQYGVDSKIVRIFNTYGPFMDINDGRVISNFIVQALTNKDITVYGDGSQTRSFCYAADLVQGLISMMRAKNVMGPINLGNPDERSILEIAQSIIELTHSLSRIIYNPLPADDPGRRKPDISLAEKLLGWKPATDFETGLASTIEYFRGITE